jgi:hypothetical protein
MPGHVPGIFCGRMNPEAGDRSLSFCDLIEQIEKFRKADSG